MQMIWDRHCAHMRRRYTVIRRQHMKQKWWMGKVAYQIWPKSFADANGDGIGDLEGIIGKLDYLKDLGVDIIWISPVYRSPLVDQGYDISDYYDINPVFGDLETMDRLIAEAKKRDMYIIMDLVVNHCSDEHEWFQKAMKDPDGEYGKYFYIAEKKDGKLPCNWRSYFGGSVWEPIPGTDKYYLHSFHRKQPDLNWENPKLRQEIYKMMNWWLDRGIAGFRIDAIINIKKKLPFQDYEPDRDDGLAYIGRMLEDAEGVGEFLEEMKHKTFEKYDAFTVGEVFNDKASELREFIGENGHFSSKFDFAPEMCGKHGGWYEHETVTAEMYKNAVFDSQMTTGEIGFFRQKICRIQVRKRWHVHISFCAEYHSSIRDRKSEWKTVIFRTFRTMMTLVRRMNTVYVWMQAAQRRRHLTWLTHSAVTTPALRFSGATKRMRDSLHTHHGSW